MKIGIIDCGGANLSSIAYSINRLGYEPVITNNQNKLSEIRSILSPEIEILSLKEINCKEELPETNPTLQQNAIQKARFVFENYGFDCFADDTGLEIDELGGEPGVYSARFQIFQPEFIRQFLMVRKIIL